jgi:molybdenum cofactor cytidylyltransferase
MGAVSGRDLVVGVVLAAGASRRMGRPKALLSFGPGGEPFVVRIVRTMFDAGLLHAIVVHRPADAALRSTVAPLGPGVTTIANPEPERGQLSSLLTAIERAEDMGAHGVLVMPVDIPAVRAGTIRLALDEFRRNAAPIVRVTHRTQHGHPVIFGAGTFDELRRADSALGAKAVLRAHAGALIDLEVDDPGVLSDVDVPEDYRRLFGVVPPDAGSGE